jgi:glycosyltransferase involved in cell wall biosynthesis
MVILANAFAKRQFKVDLVLATAEGPYITQVSNDVQIIDLKSSRVLTSLPGLVRYLRRKKPTAMLSALGHANVIAVAASMLAAVPTRVVVSERNNVSVSRKHTKSIRAKALRLFMRWAYRRADGIVAVSGGVANDLATCLGLPRSSVRTVYNPIEIDEIRKLSCQPSDHSWLLSGKVPVLLGVGRLEQQKDFSCLINAVARLRESRNVRLIILGEGTLRTDLEREIRNLGLEDDVCLPGFTVNPFSFMAKADLFVLSSKWEGLPNVLIQAMACGTPVVSTNCPSGPAEILEDGKWGRLVPVGDAEALANAMAETLDEIEHPDVTVRASEFSVKRAVDGYLKMMLPDKYL